MIIRNRQLLLPVDMGDTVYAAIGNEVHAFVVVKATIEAIGEYAACDFMATDGDTELEFCEFNIGNSVFFTRTDAEKALKGGEG